jgi:5'-3' exonuclease
MGIKKLSKYIREKYPECIQENPIHKLAGKVIGIDTPWLLYKYKLGFKQEELWINFFINLLIVLLDNCVTPIFILEGRSEVEKFLEQNKRKAIVDKINTKTKYLKELIIKLKNNKTSEDENQILEEFYEKNKKKNQNFSIKNLEKLVTKRDRYKVKVTSSDNDELLFLLNIMNIPIIRSRHEAETTGCFFNSVCKKIDYMCSGDSDVLAYKGVNYVINNFDTKNNTFTIIDKTKLLQKINITEDQFIDWCILCGTDYNTTKKGIGINTSLKYIKNSEEISDLTEEEKNCYNFNFIRRKFKFDEREQNYYMIGDFPNFEEPNICLESLEIFNLFFSTKEKIKEYIERENLRQEILKKYKEKYI